MDGDERKEDLIVKINDAADRHLNSPRKGSKECARILRAVAQSLQEMPTDARAFVKYWAAWYWPQLGEEYVDERILEQIQVENNFVRNYGLHSAASGVGEDFLSELTDRLQEVRDRSV
ncbi:MAG: hypothetical protein ACOZAM_15460 [Pseudomonadota bacterium]